MSGKVSDLAPVTDDDADLVSDEDETNECGVCGGTIVRIGSARYFKWRGKLRISEVWSCSECRTSGNRLISREDGRIVRLSPVFTGNGFEILEEDDRLVTDGGTGQDNGETKREREARRFWSKYDVPFEFGTAIKVRRSGLARGSGGNGRARDTVVHLHVVEAFTDGRLSRPSNSYLCEPNSHVTDQATEKSLSEDLEQVVTCETCLDRMDRWKRSLEERLDQEGSR